MKLSVAFSTAATNADARLDLPRTMREDAHKIKELKKLPISLVGAQ